MRVGRAPVTTGSSTLRSATPTKTRVFARSAPRASLDAEPTESVAAAALGSETLKYDSALEPHERGGVLVQAILAAMTRVFERRIRRINAIHALSVTSGRGLHPDVRDLLVEEAATTASHLQKGQRCSQRSRLAKTRRKIAWQASSHSSRRPGPSSIAPTPSSRS